MGRSWVEHRLYTYVILFKAALLGNHFDQHKKGSFLAILILQSPGGTLMSVGMKGAS